VLLLAYLVVAVLGTWTRCQMVSDGAVLFSAVWFGNTWDLHLSQIASRVVWAMMAVGPLWLVQSTIGLSAQAFLPVAHALYFGAPLILWLLIRRVEPHAAFSRLYLAAALALVYFVTEVTVAVGLWLVWLAIATSPQRTPVQIALATVGLGVLMIFSHPSTILMTSLYLIVGAALVLSGRPLPRRSLIAAAAMTVLLSVGYVVTSRLFPATNATSARALAQNANDFIDPWWMLATIGRSPMLAALWLLMLAPGLNAAVLRWRLPPPAVWVIGGFGLWFAVNGVTQVTWVYARHTAVHVLALAATLALAAPSAAWLAAARRALSLFAAITVAAALSYSVDLVLLERYVASRLAPGYVDAETLRDPPWPPPRTLPTAGRVLFKWTAGADYVRDVVVPDYDWYVLTLAFQSFFQSDRTAVLFHRISDSGWVPYQCAPVRRALDQARDERDARFLRFILDTGYCVP
jgi:hypothetical protein